MRAPSWMSDDVGRRRALRLEAGERALLPAGAAERRRAEQGSGGGREKCQRGLVKSAIVGVDDDGGGAKVVRRRQRLERVAEEGLSRAIADIASASPRRAARRVRPRRR